MPGKKKNIPYFKSTICSFFPLLHQALPAFVSVSCHVAIHVQEHLHVFSLPHLFNEPQLLPKCLKISQMFSSVAELHHFPLVFTGRGGEGRVSVGGRERKERGWKGRHRERIACGHYIKDRHKVVTETGNCRVCKPGWVTRTTDFCWKIRTWLFQQTHTSG